VKDLGAQERRVMIMIMIGNKRDDHCMMIIFKRQQNMPADRGIARAVVRGAAGTLGPTP
jgi:hypothetical protein